MFVDIAKINKTYQQANTIADFLRTKLDLVTAPNFELAEAQDGIQYYYFKDCAPQLTEKLANLNKKLFGQADSGFQPVIEQENAEPSMIAIPVELLAAASTAIRRTFDETIRIQIPEESELLSASFSGKFKTDEKLNEILTRLGVKPAEKDTSWWLPENTIAVDSKDLLAYTKQQTHSYCSPLLNIAPEILERKLAKANSLLAPRGIQLSVGIDPENHNQCYLTVDKSLLEAEDFRQNIDVIKELIPPKFEILRPQRAVKPEPQPEKKSWADRLKESTQRIKDSTQKIKTWWHRAA